MVDHNTGAIDWNRNGVFDMNPVRASLSWGFNSCDAGSWYKLENTSSISGRFASALARIGSTLYWFTTYGSGQMEYRTATLPGSTCGSSGNCNLSWTPNAQSNGTSLPAISLADDVITAVNTGSNIMLLYGTCLLGSCSLKYYPLGASSATAVPNSSGFAGPGATTYSGKVYLYAYDTATNNVWTWTYTVSTQQWSSRTQVLWSNGAAVKVTKGAGVTSGKRTYKYLNQWPVADVLYGAFPDQNGVIHVGYANPASPATWYEIQVQSPASDLAKTVSQPAIAYVPFQPSSPNYGRLYVGWNPGTLFVNANNNDCGMRQMVSEGNVDPAWTTTSRLGFYQRSIHIHNKWDCSSSNISYLYDLASDYNLREAHLIDYGATGRLSFAPAADGIVNESYRDQDDYSIIRADLKCAVTNDIGSCPE
jgi:hypothetical protein